MPTQPGEENPASRATRLQPADGQHRVLVPAATLLLIGAGMGATITPAMAAALQAIGRPAIGAATATIGTIQRIAGSVGTALLAITLQHAMAAHLPGFHGSIGRAAAIAAADPARALPALAQAFDTTFWVAFALTVASLVPALVLPGRQLTAARQPAPQPQQVPGAPQARRSPEPAAARRWPFASMPLGS